MEKNNEQTDDGGGVQVQCVEAPDGDLIVTIRTLTDEELERLLRHSAPRAEARALISHLDLAEPELQRRPFTRAGW